MRALYGLEPPIPRRYLRRTLAGGYVCYPFPGRPVLYGRQYVIPRNPRTRPQVRMRKLLGALSRDWFALLTPPQRDAWNLYARKANRRWGRAWTDRARQLRRCPPHTWTDADRQILRRCRFGYRPLSGQQLYVKLNSVLGRIGRAKLLWPPPLPVPFQPSPVEGLRIRWAAAGQVGTPRRGVRSSEQAPAPNPNPNQPPRQNVRPPAQQSRLRIELVLARPVKGDLLVFASAPCSAGWSKLRHPVYLGLLPAPHHGISDITALYLARFGALTPNQQVFIRTRLHRHGWEIATADHSALVPPNPLPIHTPGYIPPHTPCTRETGPSPAIYAPRPHPGLSPAALGLRTSAFGFRHPSPRGHSVCSLPSHLNSRPFRARPRRKSHCRQLWRGG